ncbi:MAG: SemiSWEET family transporter [Patescibacteria group bacterium]
MTTIGIITVILSLTVTGLGLTSQVRKNRKRKSMEGLSFFYFSILAISYSFWVLYGIVLRDWILIIPMSIGAIMSWVMVVQFFIYKNSKISIQS